MNPVTRPSSSTVTCTNSPSFRNEYMPEYTDTAFASFGVSSFGVSCAAITAAQNKTVIAIQPIKKHWRVTFISLFFISSILHLIARKIAEAPFLTRELAGAFPVFQCPNSYPKTPPTIYHREDACARSRPRPNRLYGGRSAASGRAALTPRSLPRQPARSG